jgi:hypothetical protein
MRQSFLNIHRAYHSILLQHGMSQETLDEWSRHIDKGEHQLSSSNFIVLPLQENIVPRRLTHPSPYDVRKLTITM